MEIERKFLIDNDKIPQNLKNYRNKHIVQDYLYVDGITVIRKRCITTDTADKKFIYTIKTNKVGCSVNEIESQINEEQYNKLKLNSNYHTLEKTRYLIPYMDKFTIELDVFEGIYDGIVFAEIEFENEQQMLETSIPSWFGRELSTSVTNSMMATMDVEQIKELIKKDEF